MMIAVRCQECGGDIAIVADDVIAERIRTGEYVEAERFRKDGKNSQGEAVMDVYEKGIWGICRKCANKPVRGDSEAQADAQMIRIRESVALIRERRKDLTLEEAVKAAVEYEYLLSHEADRGFRAYLLGEGAPKDPATDAAAREFVRQLDGPHAGGAA